MKYLILISYLLLSLAAMAQWKPIFNGKNTTGWQQVGDGKFEVEEGMLKTVGGMGLLFYAKKPLENVVVRVVFKNPYNQNAGVFIRIPAAPTEPWMPVNKGYEVQIDDRGDEFHRTGVLYSLTQAKAQASKPHGEWNTMEITLDGARTIVHLNGTLITDYTEGDPVPPKKLDYEPDRGIRPVRGYIGLQNHGNNDTVYFKEISIRKLKK